MALKDKIAKAKFSFKDEIFCLDGRLNGRRDKLMQELAMAAASAEKGSTSGDSRLGRSDIKVIQDKIAALEERMKAVSVTLRFTAVNNGVWQKGIIQHPPRKNNDTDKALGYNFETFFPDMTKLTAQYVEEPGTEENDYEDAVLEDVSEADWNELFEAWTAGDWDRVQLTLITLNQREGARGVGFLGRASTSPLASEPTSDSPEN